MIAVVYPEFYGVQGIARYVDSFLANLPQGHPPVLLVTGTEHRREVSYPGVEFHHIPLASDRLSLYRWGAQASSFLAQAHSQGRVRMVNYHWPPLIPGLFLPRGIPTILTAHTTYLGMSGRFYPERYYRSQWGAMSVFVKRWMERRILDRTDRIVALTEQGRQEVLRYGFKGPIDIVPNGADTVKFSPDPDRPKDIDVLFSGRIETRKGSRAIGAVCKRLVARRPDIRISIVGYGDDDEYVKEQVRDLPQVHMAGKIPFAEMRRFYERSRLYLSTSYYEGLPGTCLEAMAMELPPVVWDFDFYRDLVESGRTGFAVPPNDFDAMAARACELLDAPDKIRQFGSRARQVLETGYDWKALAGRILDIFAKV